MRWMQIYYWLTFNTTWCFVMLTLCLILIWKILFGITIQRAEIKLSVLLELPWMTCTKNIFTNHIIIQLVCALTALPITRISTSLKSTTWHTQITSITQWAHIKISLQMTRFAMYIFFSVFFFSLVRQVWEELKTDIDREASGWPSVDGKIGLPWTFCKLKMSWPLWWILVFL